MSRFEAPTPDDRSSIRARRPPRGEPSKSYIEKLELIKEVAAQHFFELGYAATDLRRIADSMDMHVSTLYNYIQSKEALLYLIMKDGQVMIEAAFAQAVASADQPDEQVRAALRAHILHYAHRRYLAWTSYVELRSLSGDELADLLRMRKAYENRWLKLLKKAMASGTFAMTDLKLATYSLLSTGPSVSRWYRPGGRKTADAIADELTEIALAGLLAR